MKKIGIYYGSTTGTTEDIAYKIAKLLNVDDHDVHDVGSSAPSSVADYDVLVFGTSTWGDGDLQDNWEDFVAGVEELALPDKKIALFGCGSTRHSDTFCNGVGTLYNRLQKTGAEFVAPYNTIGYEFDKSTAKPEGALEAVGLLLDENSHADLTPERLKGWTDLVRAAAN